MRTVASTNLTFRLSLRELSGEVMRQTLEEIRRAGHGELSGKECARLAEDALRVRREFGGDRDGA